MASELTLHVTDRGGGRHALMAFDGASVMDFIRDNGLPIKAACGGVGACVSCHVYVAEEWLDKLAPPTAAESVRLADAVAPQDNSRLCCLLRMSAGLDGLAVTLAPGSEPDAG